MEQKLSGQVTEEGEGTLNDSNDSVASVGAADSLHAKLIRLGVCQSKCDDGSPGDTRKVLVVDGGTLLYALNPSVRRLFLNVARKYHSVIGCRATPLQKVRTLFVELARVNLQLGYSK